MESYQRMCCSDGPSTYPRLTCTSMSTTSSPPVRLSRKRFSLMRPCCTSEPPTLIYLDMRTSAFQHVKGGYSSSEFIPTNVVADHVRVAPLIKRYQTRLVPSAKHRTSKSLQEAPMLPSRWCKQIRGCIDQELDQETRCLEHQGASGRGQNRIHGGGLSKAVGKRGERGTSKIISA